MSNEVRRRAEKRYRASRELVFAVRTLLKENGCSAEIETEGGQAYVKSNASSAMYHECVVRALCRRTSSALGFPHAAQSEVSNQAMLMRISEEEKCGAIGIAESGFGDRSRYEEPDDDYVDFVAELIGKATEGLSETEGIMRIGLSDEVLKEQAKAADLSERNPDVVSAFDVDAERAERLTALALRGETENVAKWLRNAETGDRLIVYRNLKAPVGRGFVNGSHMSKRFPLTGIAVMTEKDGADSFRVTSSYPCVAGDDLKAIRADMKEWRRRYVGRGDRRKNG